MNSQAVKSEEQIRAEITADAAKPLDGNWTRPHKCCNVSGGRRADGVEVLSGRCVPHCARACARAFTHGLFVVNVQSGGKARCQCVAKGPGRRAHLKDRLHKRADFPHPLLLLLLHPFTISCPLTPLAVQQAEEEGIYKSAQTPAPAPIYHNPLHLPVCRWRRRGEAGGGV